MEPSSDLYRPWRLYARAGWVAFAGTLISCLCGLYEPFAFIPAGLLLLSSALLFWFATRPPVLTFPSQFNIGKRSIAWQEVRSIDQVFGSPLILRLKLTNNRRKLLIFPGEPVRITKLIAQIRNRSFLATFDGVPYRDFHVWSRFTDAEAEELGLHQPVQMISPSDEQEIERLYQKLKTVGRLDSSATDDARSSKED